ncbi:MAG: hypothetical protein EKK57_11260 [Proteobacteria bacterium]|nr:MAG: hypothetical protein EKK57_11260 [Pseudomonadota bacterium]
MILTTEQNDILLEKNNRVLILRDFSGTLRTGIVASFNGDYRIGTWVEGFTLQMFLDEGWVSILLNTDVNLGLDSIKLPTLLETEPME